MYNKYFTMKRSELKEAIKAEIKSVLSEAMSDEEREDKLQQAKRGGGKEEPLRKLAAIGKKSDEKDLKEVYQTNSKMSQIVSLFQDMMDDEYDGQDYRKVLNMVLKAIDDDYKAAEREGEKFSRIREGTWSVGTKEQIGNFIKDMEKIKIHYNDIVGDDEVYNGLDSAVSRAEEMIEMVAENKSDIREEDEPTDAEIKKADSVASAANKLQKLVKKMKDKAKDFKAAEGEAKEKIKDELKVMTAEKKKLEKSI